MMRPLGEGAFVTDDVIEVTVSEDQAGGRLDKVLAALVPKDRGLSRARVQQLLAAGAVFQAEQDGPEKSVTDVSGKVMAGVLYRIVVPPPVSAQPKAEDMPLDIVYEDDDLLVINKEPGVVVHPAAGHWEGTLVNALLAHCKGSLSGIGGVERPGIVHRLDKDTSGLLVVAKNDLAHQKLSAQFSDHSLSRTYQALVWRLPSASGQVEGAIGRHPRARQKMAVVEHGGKEALTFFKLEQTFGSIAALVSCKLATGRTHQIRVHMAHIRHPVVGDPLYGTRQKHGGIGATEKGIVALLEAFPRQALHAGEISFMHPRTGKKIHLRAPMPGDMADLLKQLKKKTC